MNKPIPIPLNNAPCGPLINVLPMINETKPKKPRTIGMGSINCLMIPVRPMRNIVKNPIIVASRTFTLNVHAHPSKYASITSAISFVKQENGRYFLATI